MQPEFDPRQPDKKHSGNGVDNGMALKQRRHMLHLWEDRFEL